MGVISTGRGRPRDLQRPRPARPPRGIDAEAGDVALVLRGGAALYGDSSLVAALPGGADCDALDVCDVEGRVRGARPRRPSPHLAHQREQRRYPLFFCGEPMNEPSCLPERNAMGSLPNPVVNGSTRYSGVSSVDDFDGDGSSTRRTTARACSTPSAPSTT
ncbi:MAG: hypothetical protein R3A52_09050 [Polyangiales bacterium]